MRPLHISYLISVYTDLVSKSWSLGDWRTRSVKKNTLRTRNILQIIEGTEDRSSTVFLGWPELLVFTEVYDDLKGTPRFIKRPIFGDPTSVSDVSLVTSSGPLSIRSRLRPSLLRWSLLRHVCSVSFSVWTPLSQRPMYHPCVGHLRMAGPGRE